MSEGFVFEVLGKKGINGTHLREVISVLKSYPVALRIASTISKTL